MPHFKANFTNKMKIKEQPKVINNYKKVIQNINFISAAFSKVSLVTT